MQGPLHRTRFNCWRAVEFVTYIIEIYLFYIEEYFCHLEEEHLTIVDSLVKEVLKVGEFEQSLYEDNFEEFYDLVDNCMKNRSKRHPKVVAAKMLHFFALRS